MFLQDGKTAFRRKNIWEIGTQWFSLAGKSVSTSQNKGFVVKINQAGKSFNCQEYLKNGEKIGFHWPE